MNNYEKNHISLTKEEIIAIINKEKFASIKECMAYFSKMQCDKKLVSEVFRSM